MWGAEGTQGKKSDERAEALDEFSHLTPSFPEAEAALLISLELAKKIPHLYTKKVQMHHIAFHFLFSSALLTYTQVVIFHQPSLGIHWGDQLCSSSLSEAPWGGRDVWVRAQPSIWGCTTTHHTSSISSCLFSVSLAALGVCLGGMTAEGVIRGRMTVASRLQSPLKVWKRSLHQTKRNLCGKSPLSPTFLSFRFLSVSVLLLEFKPQGNTFIISRLQTLCFN